jgi:hypothetical protein
MESLMHRILFAPLALCAIAALSTSSRADVVTDNTSLASPPGLYFGTGNVNSGFTVDTNGGVELGLSAVNRFVGPIVPTGDVYTVQTGSAASGGSTWGVDFSINLQLPGGSLTLNQITPVITVTDEGDAFNDTIPNFIAALTGNTCFGPVGGVEGSSSSTTAGAANCPNFSTDYGIQNSSPGNLFAAIGDSGFNENIADTYDVTLSVYQNCVGVGCTPTLLASDTIQINAVPEPDTLVIFGAILAGLGYLTHRRRAGGTVV